MADRIEPMEIPKILIRKEKDKWKYYAKDSENLFESNSFATLEDAIEDAQNMFEAAELYTGKEAIEVNGS